MKSRGSTSKPEPCPCGGDGFADLPPEMRPRSERKSNLRRVTCPGCGLAYSTNRATDLCMACEKKGAAAP